MLLDPAPARPVSAELLAFCDYVTPNESELAVLAGQEPVAVAGPGGGTAAGGRRPSSRRRRVLVKMGSAGALLVDEAGEQFWAAPRVEVVDTTAAGDCFNGAFAVALAEGRSEAEAGRFATLAASLSVTRPGAQPSMPTRAEVEVFAAHGFA